jgi:hypothetical protein
MTLSRRLTSTTVLLALVAMLIALVGATPALGDAERTYRVTITNLTDGQLLTPLVVAAHSGSTAIFRSGKPASSGLQSLAENGGVPDLAAELAANPRVGDVAVAGAEPLAPGTSAFTDITSAPGARKLSVAGMLICTNDGFGAINSAQLDASGKTQVLFGSAYDAGTEINTEAYEDLVPPCDGLGQTGTTNPDLAEGAVVHRHQGIQGGADLDPAIHGWTGPVIMVTIEPLD